eukprot:TRINITY_DN2633_c0_g1_i2.p1 TRINITY_DN2633_c0_g1~~TRINITY_DN2633_c0_g1_i2.p1  ORF type:complete len:375 (+),score=8.36 TRINITY_DN2633_c0_g1_i2:48-1172(+)
MEREFECLICADILNDAVEITCCNSLCCQGCFDEVIKREDPLCPNCRAPKGGSRPNVPVRRMVSNLPAECPNRCGEKVTRGTLEEHKAKCPLGVVICARSERCPPVLRKELEQHRLNMCPLRPVPCPNCGDDVVYEEMQKHLDAECQEGKVECQNCHAGLLRKELTDHEDECPEAKISCTFSVFGCKKRPKRKNEEDHMKDSMHIHLSTLVDSVCEMKSAMKGLTKKLKVEEKLRLEAEKCAAKFRWTIKWDDCKDLPTGKTIESKTFSQFGHQWCLLLYPNGEEQLAENVPRYISVYLKPTTAVEFPIGWRIVMVNSDPSKNVRVNSEHLFKGAYGLGYRKFHGRNSISEESGFLCGGILELQLFFTMCSVTK